MDGFETARRIRQLEGGQQTPILFLTAIHRSREYEAQGYALGAVDYLSKPFDPEVLRAKVAALVDLAKRGRTAQELVRSCHAAMLEAALDAVVTIDAHSCVVEWNAAAGRIFGYARDRVLGKDLSTFLIPPAYREAHRAGMERYLRTGETSILGSRVELTALHASGRELPVEVTVTRIPSEGPPLFTAYLRDLTEQKRSEVRLRTQFEVTRILAESPDLPQAVPGLMQVICLSKGWDWAAFWEVEPLEEVLRLIDCFPCRDGAEFAHACASVAFKPEAGLPGRVWASGQPIWVPDVEGEPNFPRAQAARAAGFRSALALPIRTDAEVLGVMEFLGRTRREPDPATLAVLGSLGSQIGQFIQRKRAEGALMRREEQLRHLQSVTDAALAHLPLDELLEALLARVCAALHTDSATVLLLEEGELAVRASRGLGPDLMGLRVPLGQGLAGTVAATGRPRLIEDTAKAEIYSRHLIDPEIRSLLGVPLRAQEQIVGVLHVGTRQPRRFSEEDVHLLERVADRVALAADRARLIAAIEEESTRKSDFLSIMAHELRTPLSAISNALYILENMEIPDERAARQLMTAKRQTRQLARLAEDLLDIGRISKGKVELRRETVVIGAMAREAAESVRPFADARGQELLCELTPETLRVCGDPDRLEQVLNNLLQNAVKYTEPGGEVLLSVRREAQHAVIQVRDTGIGIDPPMLPQIFDLFRQVERDDPRVRGGMGIGLALVKRLVELHDGTIEVHSEGRGKGTTFTVRLPLLE
jgi:PAS domain S-box-containing protein